MHKARFYSDHYSLLLATSFMLAVLLLLASGCKQNEGQRISLDEANGFTKTFRSGPVELDVQIASTRIRVADNLQVQLQVRAPETYEIGFPELAEELDQWQVADRYQELPKLNAENTMVHVWNMALRATQAGEFSVPELEITFREKDGKDQKQKIRTEAVPITVVSLLDPAAQGQDIEDILAPMAIPSNKWLIILLVGIGLLILGGAAWWFWRKRQSEIEAIPALPPHVVALQALQNLLAGKLVEAGRFKEFYFAVSAILRRYIEDRFELRAPESTTEEFLNDLGSTNALAQDHKQLLKQFLQHCDQVKFAKYQPTATEIEQTATLCKKFIQETKAAETAGEESNAV